MALFNLLSTDNPGKARAAIRAVTVLEFDDGWPVRVDNGLPVIYVGGDAPADAPADSIAGDLWFPTSGDTDATKQSVLAPTAVKTTTYTAAVSDLIPADATAGGFTIDLPTAPVDKARVVAKKIDATTNIVTVAAHGSDVFNKAGGSTTLTLSLPNQAVQLQYQATGAIWYVVSTDVPLSGLDTRYMARAIAYSMTFGS